jgi:hypothetical protein
MKASWLLAPVLLGVMAVGQDANNGRLEAALPHLNRTDASAQRALTAALRDWRTAYGRAQALGSAEALVEVGDRYRRIGEASSTPAPFDAKAGEIYASALSRARRQGSLDDVLRVAEAFAELGDRPALERALGVAVSLTANDPEARADLHAFAARVAVVVDDLAHAGR